MKLDGHQAAEDVAPTKPRTLLRLLSKVFAAPSAPPQMSPLMPILHQAYLFMTPLLGSRKLDWRYSLAFSLWRF